MGVCCYILVSSFQAFKPFMLMAFVHLANPYKCPARPPYSPILKLNSPRCVRESVVRVVLIYELEA